MAEKNSRRHGLLGALFSFLVLASLLALFFEFRRSALVHLAPAIRVSARRLPYYAFCSFYRMLAAYVLALGFSIVYGMAAARSHAYERVLLPAIDVAQSVPVIAFFPFAIYFFVSLVHGRLGVEFAAIFLIFTSQAWNMALGVYESVKTIPVDSAELLEAFGVSGWLRLKRLLLPACVPKLVYNSILSWVAGWYFLTACEIIIAGPVNYRLPGLGSYLMDAAEKGGWGEQVAGLATLLAIIIAMDLLVWQPLSVWAEKFRYEFAAAAEPLRSPGALEVFSGVGPVVVRGFRAAMLPLLRAIWRLLGSIPRPGPEAQTLIQRAGRLLRLASLIALIVVSGFGLGKGVIALIRTLLQPWPAEVRLIPGAAGASTIRMVIAYAVSLAWTVPCALAASENPRFNRVLAPIAEIAGSMPATALFPVIVIFVIKATGGMNLAAILLILTGMQWYLLFNLLAGVRTVPEDLKEASRAFGLTRSQTWRKLTIPALLPSLITGSMTAWGGGWNALILSEYVVYRDQHYSVLGLGALLDEATYKSGNGVMILLSLLSMVAIVIGLNRLLWRRLYGFTTQRYRLDY